MSLKSALVLAAAAGLVSVASAQNAPVMGAMPAKNIVPPQTDAEALWDQSAFDFNLAATVNTEFPDFASYSTYAVDDFNTDGERWNVETITVYFTQGFGFWNPADVLEGSVQLFPKNGSLPQNTDTVPEHAVGVRVTDGGGYWIIKADVSGIDEFQNLVGEYWVGLTPTVAFGTYGQEFHLQLQGFYRDNAAFRNNGGAFGLGTGWNNNSLIGGAEMAFKLEGSIGGGNECYADFTQDGVLDLFDFLAFVNSFNAGEDQANCDGEGGLDLFDFLCFTNAFNAGC